MAPATSALYLGLDSSTQSLSAVVLEVVRRPPSRGARAVARLRRGASPLRHAPRRAARRRPGRGPLVAGDVGRSARPAARRASPISGSSCDGSRPSRARRSSTAACISTTPPGAGSRRSTRRGRCPLADRAAPVAADRADLDGLEHARRVRRDRGGGGRRRDAGAAHRLARLRALHRPADPQVRHARARRLRGHRSRAPGELVSRVGARRPARAGRSRRRGGDEPDGSRVGRGGGRRHVDATAPGLLPQAPGRRAVVGHRRAGCRATGSAARAAPRPRWRCGPATTRAASSASAWCAKGRVGVSLGTSDTIFGLMRDAARRLGGTGHVFGVAHRRLHGHHGVQQRLAGARARPRSLSA